MFEVTGVISDLRSAQDLADRMMHDYPENRYVVVEG
jgi:hypothetical protein